MKGDIIIMNGTGLSALPISETELLKAYNIFCKIWEFESDGKVDAYIRTLTIKDLPDIDSMLIENMNDRPRKIENLGEKDYLGFKIETDSFETHLYLADISSKCASSVARPIFTSSKWVNVVVADRKLFNIDVEEDHLPELIDFFGILFARCFTCTSTTLSRGIKIFYREVLANIFLASVCSMDADTIRKLSDPKDYFSKEFNDRVLKYNKEILSVMQKGVPIIPTQNPEAGYTLGATKQGKLNDLVIILSLLDYKQFNSRNLKKINISNEEDYGDEEE